MKAVALACLLAAAAVFVAAVLAGSDTGAWPYVRAAAEAAMVGGLADWFAVTALFRRPLGLPIPHTALVPTQKDRLATKLGEFVTGNFLTAAAVREQVADAQVVGRLAARVAEPATADALGREAAAAAAAALGAVDVAGLTDYALELARRDLHRRSYTPVLGRFLSRAVAGQGQRPLVDLLARRGREYLRGHRDELLPQLAAFVEQQARFAWLLASPKRLNRLLDSAIDLLGDVERDPAHPLRRSADALLASVAQDLQHNRRTALSLDRQLRRLLDDPQVRDLLHEVLADATASVRASLLERDDGLEQRLSRLVQDAAGRVLADPALAGRLERLVQDAAAYAVTHYGDAVVALIRRTVASWEARDAARRIELAVGRDLQFIRINGTVVGALAGLAIHAAGALLA